MKKPNKTLMNKASKWQSQYGLNNWNIMLLEDDIEDYGSLSYNISAMSAIIIINQSLPNEEKENTLVHELIHLCHAELMEAASRLLSTKPMAVLQMLEEQSVIKITEGIVAQGVN